MCFLHLLCAHGVAQIKQYWRKHMRILILGGTGSMGVPLTNILAQNGHEVYVTSRKERTSENENIHFLQGNAKEGSFLQEILQADHYDTIVDFMHYSTDEFSKRMDLLLTATAHYLFLSSCRVFAPSKYPLNEESPRLLDSATDEEFLATDEYALSKARNENILKDSGYRNYTIIRPYITYNTERLQLSMFEKEAWLYRALKGRSIVFCKDLAVRKTTLTHGYDVAKAMAKIIENRLALGDSGGVNIVTNESITWGEILEQYVSVIKEETGKMPNVVILDDTAELGKIIGNTYKLKYDRLSDRVFDNAKVERLTGTTEYTSVKDGLRESLKNFLQGDSCAFKPIRWHIEAYFDRITGERTLLKEIPSYKQRIRYLIYRYTPYLSLRAKKTKDVWW